MRTRIGLAAGILAVGVVSAAGADGGHGGGRFVPGAPQPNLDPGAAIAQGLLQRDFLYMRATSPNPSRFPTPLFALPPGGTSYRYPPSYGYGGGYPYGGGYYPYNYGFGSYGYPGYSDYSGYSNYLPLVPPQVIVVPDPNAAGAGGVRSAPAKPETTPKPETNPNPEKQRSDDFYLKGNDEGESISDALDDIRQAWLKGDWERLKARFSTDGKVGIYPGGTFKYSVDSGDFARLLKQAMSRIETTAFDLDRPRSDEPGRAFVSGKHTFLDVDKKKQETYVSYTLSRVDRKWKIIEAGSSSSPIKGHEK